ncbi:phospholipase D-like domain-containing protein [Hymenobacter cellulosilyticus]|uniref:phospholipase D n=1 Tax=Hymenobacter cellulosilyticus TaxID=2932248 RepID=A0A8T9Q2K3_9BACT|nr:phospholipase D-like domain-containing protein [Hymenobacter cellulosilyticus]UOQ71255.1 phospholipase D-like domain-containing protein [Hymenobacter cellulosilyticus]
MKRITLLSLLALGAGLRPAIAQTVETIASARAKGVGAAVAVRGTVSNGSELGAIRYLQDKEAGVAAYATTTAFTSLGVGDSIEVRGTLKNFNGILEIDPVTSVTVLGRNRPLTVAEVDVATASSVYAEVYESRLVRVNGNTSVTAANGAAVTVFAGNTNYLLNAQPTLVIRPNTASTGAAGLVGKPVPTGPFDIIGIMSQFSTTGTGGYQLLPRLYADIVLEGPKILNGPVPSALTRNSFTVSFTTQFAGDTKLEYGTTPALGTVLTTATATTSHQVSLTGLQPATVYYVRVSSTNANGTSSSGIGPMITVSNSTGKIRNYFNSSVNTSLALPSNTALYLNQTVPDTLARYIDRAQESLDVAIYNWNNQTILDAINRAQARGIKVRLIYEATNANNSVKLLNAAIPRIGRDSDSDASNRGIMHNKFVVIDANSANATRPWVWTGSTNWTQAQLFSDNNNVIAVQDQSLARTYTMEFEEIWGSTGPTPGTPVFGNRKTDNTPHFFVIGGSRVESWFSPTDNVNARLLESIRTADNDLHIETMLITLSEIGQVVRDQVQLRNIANCSEALLNDTSNTGTGAIFRTIRTALGTRIMVKNTGGIMHHKTLIVDAGASQSDPQVFVGSHNWSLSANTTNDENTLVVHDPLVVNRYYQEFAARIADQNRGISVCNLVLANKTATVQQSSIQVYPNPTHGKFQLRVAAASKARTATVTLRDATGRVVLTQTQAIGVGEEVKVDASALGAGLYMVQVVTPESTQVSRVVVE